MGKKIKPKIFISYSSQNQEFIERIFGALEALNLFQITIDEKEINHGDIIDEKIKKLIKASDIFLLSLSNTSIQSEWVKFEVEIGLKRSMENKDNFLFIPLQIEELKLNNNSSIIERINSMKINVAKFELPDSFENEFFKLVKVLSKKFNIDNNEITNKVVCDLGKQVNKELTRYKNIIDGVFTKRLEEKLKHVEDKIENIYQLSYLKSKILTPNDILDIESKIEYDIWIITTHMKNDEDILFSTVIDKNIKEGVNYTYFYPNELHLQRKIEKYKKIHLERKIEKYERNNQEGTITFIPLDIWHFFPYDEVAIYNPLDKNDIRGYMQLSYEDGIFIELNKDNLYKLQVTLEILKKESDAN